MMPGTQQLILALQNDIDPNGKIDPTSVKIIRQPAHGTVSLDPLRGNMIYLPDPEYKGKDDEFTYSVADNGIPCSVLRDTARVIISIVYENNPPEAVDDFLQTTCLPSQINILINDFDPDGDVINLTSFPVRNPRKGTVTISAGGVLVYEARKGLSGIDSLWYEICDEGFPSKCDTGTVIIDICKDEDCDGVCDVVSEDLFIPEGFSPNGDGVHDYFQVRGIEDYPEAFMMIFNRWGSKLFEKKNYGNLSVWGTDADAWWDGYSDNKWTLGDAKVPPGNYIYILDLGNNDFRKGTVMVSY